jgi:hypothetical protein
MRADDGSIALCNIIKNEKMKEMVNKHQISLMLDASVQAFCNIGQMLTKQW